MAINLLQIFEDSGILPNTFPIAFSVTGGGGKTTLLSHISSSWKQRGDMGICLTTTTTKMFNPETDEHHFSSIQRYDRIDLSKMGNTPFIYHTLLPESGKVSGLSPEQVGILKQLPNLRYILCESDGSRHRPLKVPDTLIEPVHPHKSDVVIAVVGLSCLGKRVSAQTVHRLESLRSITSSETIDAELIAQLTLDPKGLFSSVPVSMTKILLLNQADCINQTQLRQLISVLSPEALGISAVAICALRPTFQLFYFKGANLHG
jgi:probable selenium-dependent hydroxylase accessory protein YqeC